MISAAELSALLQVIVVDLVLAGDNAIVVGLAAAGLPAKDRARVIAIGIAAATLMRIGFAAVTVQLLQIVGLLLAGGLVLLWVAWKLWREIRVRREAHHAPDSAAGAQGSDGADAAALGHAPPKRMRDAIVQIVVADVSMSLDNVLAVAGIARDHTWVLVVGLVLSVAFMGLAAAWIARQLEHRPWIAYVGLAVIFYVAMAMIVEGWREVAAVAGV
ncbi:MAG: YjbE family putative metal transport protein [Chromatiales bacterium]|nr:YjbE family putative metal transport protein [Chromatiales bacterium]